MDLFFLIFGLILLGALIEFVKTKYTIDPAILWLVRLIIIVAVVLMFARLFGKYIPNVL